jgi:tRNA G46 methylase TrmB
MQHRRERIIDPQAENKIALRCKTTGRLNARADHAGIYMFCRQCNTQHLLSWADLEELKQGIQMKTCHHVVYI